MRKFVAVAVGLLLCVSWLWANGSSDAPNENKRYEIKLVTSNGTEDPDLYFT